MIGLLTWATGGGRWRLYLIGVVVAVVGTLIAYWRHRVASDAVAAERADAVQDALKRAVERAKTDDEIRSLPPDDRRERLRQWAPPD